ncbi:phosphoribosylformylglycinamidine synthase, synthetase subunit [Pseudanabaena sp. lw0831]|uniref:phosphoribosylformylglycinamidine synthase subunit PurL n=1 Tax=Pseudanabaena sp. lw0831 TaxID=1357935 RepID=UPI001916C3DC|nr:phosphoribosylformylglycinamidine synthase subunit PurL [Pseudanabaena sp. lw0831]GBO53199.1 phosphoribosylformylglycinamidine synthase, synthetase subunit [Pseudanabaena sp. lw0831]
MTANITTKFSPAEIKSEGLTLDEYQMICDRLGREPNKAELGMFGVMWSEHCCYKNSRPLLKQFPTTGDRILVGPGENAGVVKITDDIAISFKIESHNRPSAVEPYQGAATGVGGILRDIFTMGARPVAILNSLRFGELSDPWVRSRVNGIVNGIAGYGNCIGVPTVGGEVYFDKAYNRNPLVNAMAIGIMETKEIVKSGASGTGNPVIYVGSTTGRDGMKGASFASAEISDKSEQSRSAVQVGDPFLEKALVEACLEAFKTGAVVAAQDMGAAGLTCSTSEMAAKGGVGVVLDLDKIPARETGMTPYEYLLSESQERMLFVAHKGREAELIEIFERWGLHAVVAGEVLAEPIVRILWHGEVAAEIPATALADNTPIYHRQLGDTPDYAKKAWAWDEKAEIATFPSITPNDALLQLLDTPAIASKAWIYRQYDHQVQNNTVIFPGGADAAVIRLRSQGFGVGELGTAESQIDSLVGVAATVDCNARYVYLDPYEGAKLAVAEAARNLSCVGSEPLSVTDNLNFGSPENAIGYWQLHEACRGIADACRELSTPVTGGNVSLYNETIDSDGNSQPIYPTPVIGMVGLVEDVTKVVGQGWKGVGDAIYLLGSDRSSLAASEYLALVIGEVTGRPQPVDFELERKVQFACRQGIAQGLVQSAHDCSEGGLAVAIAESCISGNLTAQIQLVNADDSHLTQVLFGEGASRIVVSVKQGDRIAWETYLTSQLGNSWQHIGTVSDAASDLEIIVGGKKAIAVSLSQITKNFNEAISKRMGHIF